jgi:hypothetical protein
MTQKEYEKFMAAVAGAKTFMGLSIPPAGTQVSDERKRMNSQRRKQSRKTR